MILFQCYLFTQVQMKLPNSLTGYPRVAGLALIIYIGTMILPVWSHGIPLPSNQQTPPPKHCQPANFALGSSTKFCLQTDRTNSQALTLHIYQSTASGTYRLSDTLSIEDWYSNGFAKVLQTGPNQADMIVAQGTGTHGTGVGQTLIYLIAYHNQRFEPVLFESLSHTLTEPEGMKRCEGTLSLELLGKLRVFTKKGKPIARIDYRFRGDYQPDTETSPKTPARHMRNQWHDELSYCPATASFYGCQSSNRKKPTNVVRAAIDKARQEFVKQRPSVYPSQSEEQESPTTSMWGLLDNIIRYPELMRTNRTDIPN